MVDKITVWLGLSSSQATVILLLAILSTIAAVTRMILKHRIDLKDANNRDYESETYRMLALRLEDRLDRSLDQTTLPFEEFLKASAHRGRPRTAALPGTSLDDES